MKPKDKFKSLYRKENHRTRYGHKKQKNEACYDRHTKIGMNHSMKKNHNKSTCLSYDYTPLFKYLLSRVGDKWSDVYSDVILRVNTKEPIFWMVNLDGICVDEFFTVSENSKYSKLYVNENDILLKVNDKLTVNDFFVSCTCCTHTFNGQVINKNKIKI